MVKRVQIIDNLVIVICRIFYLYKRIAVISLYHLLTFFYQIINIVIICKYFSLNRFAV